MKISLNWLKEFVDIPDEPGTVGQKITAVGFALDGMDTAADDTIYEFDITTNRPDCLSHLGLAREVSTIYRSPLREPVLELHEGTKRTADTISIEISDPDLCGRYCGRYIEGVRIGPSPGWLKARLEGLGLRSINNVADVTNLIMMELGQPLHAFDAGTLHDSRIIVRRARTGERITTLDGQDRTLNSSILVIADADRPVAIAGVMGGGETEISSNTRNVLLESAYFFTAGIRKTARSLGMSTEASYRYERGCDIEMARRACDRAADLIQRLAGGTVLQGATDVYPSPWKPIQAHLRRNRIEAFLGAPVPDDIVTAIFQRLGLNPGRSDEGWTVTVPSFRVDIETEEDLLEEVARHYGYDLFPATIPPFSGSGSALPHEREERDLRHLLRASGYSEIYGLSFTDEATERTFGNTANPVRLLNPMSEDWTLLRSSLVSSVLKALQWNMHRGMRDLQFYELGKVYRDDSEQRMLTIAATGALRQKSLHEAHREFDFYDMKGDVEAILQAFNVDAELSREDLPPYYHPGRAAKFGTIAVFGELHPDYSGSMKPRQRVYLAELDVDLILKSRKIHEVVPLAKYPSIRRDLSLLFDRGVEYAKIRETIGSARIRELVRIEPFDRLDSGPFPETKFSLSISLIYQSPDRTLTDDEVDSFDRRILDLLEQRLAAQLRK